MATRYQMARDDAAEEEQLREMFRSGEATPSDMLDALIAACSDEDFPELMARLRDRASDRNARRTARELVQAPAHQQGRARPRRRAA
jgi:hypothetical protein